MRKDEDASDTDAITKADKILKVCTFKVQPEKRGVKLGELLVKQILWYAQLNKYDLAYLTTYSEQVALMSLIEFYGFKHTGNKDNGELIYEREFSRNKLEQTGDQSIFESGCKNYPRFIINEDVQAFGVPIKEEYHDVLYPDLQASEMLTSELPSRPGNTIRKVYLCRAISDLGDPGSLLFFYKGKSKKKPSQAITAVGLLESVSKAESTEDLMRMTGGRSVYSKSELADWKASPKRPVKVINYLLLHYIEPPIDINALNALGIVRNLRPPQSIYRIKHSNLKKLLRRIDLSFKI